MTDVMLRSVSFVLLLLTVIGCVTVGTTGDRVLRIEGSDTMLILNRRLAEAFMRVHPGVAVIAEGGGTSIGIDAMIEGDASIAAASRPLTSGEIQRLFDRHGTLGVRHLIARDSLSVWLHPDNPVDDLTLGQLRGIFRGLVTNWAQVGGAEREITVVIRPPASGTFRFFRDRILGGVSYVPDAITASTTTDVIDRVAADPSAIGYGGAAYISKDVRACALDGVPPSADDVSPGRYPLTRHLVFYTVAPPEGLARVFVDWCQGPEGQAVVADTGYLPLWERP